MTAAEALTVDIDHLRSWIGREDLGSDVLTKDLARKYHATFDLAGEPPRHGEIAPRMIHFCLAQPAVPTAQLGPDGHPERGGFLPPVPLPRRMWAGSSQSFHGDLRVGDEVKRSSRIADVVYKEGRTGRFSSSPCSTRSRRTDGLCSKSGRTSSTGIWRLLEPHRRRRHRLKRAHIGVR